MSERTYGIREEEIAWPERYAERHIASGSGWEERRGGGRVPEANPWKRDRPFKNPATDGYLAGDQRQG